MVLVNVADDLLHGIQAIAGLQSGLVGLLGAVSSVGCVLVSFSRFGGSLADTFLRAGIDVFDVLGVGGGEIVELIHPVTNRAKLALHVFLAGEGIHFAPEPLPHIRFERLPRRHVLI